MNTDTSSPTKSTPIVKENSNALIRTKVNMLNQSNAFLTIVIPAADVEAARLVFGGGFTTDCSPTGQEPATHYVSSGVVDSGLVDTLPTALPTADISATEPFTRLAELGLQPVSHPL